MNCELYYTTQLIQCTLITDKFVYYLVVTVMIRDTWISLSFKMQSFVAKGQDYENVIRAL